MLQFESFWNPSVGSLQSCSASSMCLHRKVADCGKKQSEDSQFEDLGLTMTHDCPIVISQLWLSLLVPLLAPVTAHTHLAIATVKMAVTCLLTTMLKEAYYKTDCILPVSGMHQDYCLFYILKETASLANLIRTHHCVGIEPMGLLPQFPTNRPANVALKLHPHYADRLHPSPHLVTAIDCTIIPLLQPSTPSPLVPPPPSLPPEPDPAVTPIPPDPSSPALHKHHFHYEFNKFKGCTRTNSCGKHIWGPDVLIND
jgi:hypothetical protein